MADKCKRCGGTGKIWDPSSKKKQYIDCPSCGGSGAS